ncbi:hypothetical protein [Effusibacillus consociatus]|uniref:Uncharacterized protein n=1 Tax=Effusibacillus consociatus TaxID=1117041 RepID=A0ABV9PY25_9BACL
MNSENRQAAVSLSSVLLSFLASSHHWLHMGILLLLGGSTNMMATMSGVLWIRRFMIVATVFTVLVSLYRLYRHRNKRKWIFALTIASAFLSVSMILYTVSQFGW